MSACNILRGELNLNEKYGGDGSTEDECPNEGTESVLIDSRSGGGHQVNESKILCLVGPPGVDKTSIGSSIAKSLSRQVHEPIVQNLVDESSERALSTKF